MPADQHNKTADGWLRGGKKRAHPRERALKHSVLKREDAPERKNALRTRPRFYGSG